MHGLSRTDLLPGPELNALAAAVLCDGMEDVWPRLQAQIAVICLKVCRGASADADDVTQRTCIKIFRSRGSAAGYGRGRSFHAWCSSVASNAQVDLYREARAGVKTGPLNEQSDQAVSIDFSTFYDDASPICGNDLDAAVELFAQFPETAIQVFAVSWLWRLLPEGLWDRWLTDPRICIEPPWPPVEVIDLENPREALLLLTAATFGITRDAVRKKVERQRSFILQLARAKAMLGYKE